MSATVPRRHGGPPRGQFEPLPFHGWYECRGCSAVVVSWAHHAEVCHEHSDETPEPEHAPIGPESLAERANAEGRAVVEFAAVRPWREAWRQVAACLRLFPPKNPRPAAIPADPPGAAGRAQQWATMGELIKRTTEA